MLGGLQATPGLKARILEAAAAPERKRHTVTLPRAAAAVCAVAVAVGAAFAVTRQPVSKTEGGTDGQPQLMAVADEETAMETPGIYSVSAGEEAAISLTDDAPLRAAGS